MGVCSAINVENNLGSGKQLKSIISLNTLVKYTFRISYILESCLIFLLESYYIARLFVSVVVTELIEGDSSRRIVEIICRASCSDTEKNKNNRVAIERILKVHNMQKMLAQFEEYRELVIIKAHKLAKKHPRCLADGNELLRFHGTTFECSLGLKSSSSLCTSNNCQVCWILRNGFSTKKELSNGIGVFTASTSSRALESIQESDDNGSTRKALIVCRVIAGRVHRPMENFQELVGQSGFDSLAGKMGLHSNIEELFLLSPRALLPCFVVIYKP